LNFEPLNLRANLLCSNDRDEDESPCPDRPAK
jgi:hypothetical protein